MSKKIHDWWTVNREVHQPSDIGLQEVIEEIRAAFSGKDNYVVKLVEMIDRKQYAAAGKVVAEMLKQLDVSE